MYENLATVPLSLLDQHWIIVVVDEEKVFHLIVYIFVVSAHVDVFARFVAKCTRVNHDYIHTRERRLDDG